MGRVALRTCLTAAFAALLAAATPVVRDDELLRIDDAFIQTTSDAGWTIGNSLIEYTLRRDQGQVFLQSIRDVVSDRAWLRSSSPDTYVAVGGQRIDIGGPTAPWVDVSVNEHWGGVRLDVRYRAPSTALDIVRSYVCYPGSAVIETWTTYQSTSGRSLALSELTDYAFAVTAGRLRWISGLGTPDDQGGPFHLSEGDLDDGQSIELGADSHASERQVPWFSIQAEDGHEFFGSILWSGAWRFLVTRHDDTMSLQLGLPKFSTSLRAGASLESPHAILGVTSEAMPTASLAMRGFIEKGLRHGRPLGGYVTYNTWYSYGTLLDEQSMQAEIDMAAALGVEQFVIDAGWWPGIDPNDPGNFVDGWGNWEVDRARFPDGLAALSERAHSLGMRFGIWVEPERVTMGTVGQPGLALERYLARQDSRYDPNTTNEEAKSAQVCFADAAARGWVLEKLFALIDEVHPDYLKWDNNFSVSCTRPGHSHGSEDGNFAHLHGVRTVQEALRERYPALDIENCAGGGNRLSLDMLAVTDAAWMDDHTFPSVRTRHGLEGLATVFPPSYLLSFAMTTADEPMTDDPDYDLPHIMRSRMPGILGMSLVAAGMTEGFAAALSREIALYKLIRPTIREAGTVPLTPQPTVYPGAPWSGWDAIEYISPRTGAAVILAFETIDASKSQHIRPRALQPYAVYEIESAEYGDLGSATGVELMARGIELTRSGTTRGHVLILRVR